MSNENFDSLKELQDAEDNQVLSRIDKPIPNVSDYSEYVTPQEVTDGLTYKAPKEIVIEPTIEERLAKGPRYKDKSKLENEKNNSNNTVWNYLFYIIYFYIY